MSQFHSLVKQIIRCLRSKALRRLEAQVSYKKYYERHGRADDFDEARVPYAWDQHQSLPRMAGPFCLTKMTEP